MSPFTDLESAICDACLVASINLEIVGELSGEVAHQGKISVSNNRREKMLFLAGDLDRRLRDLEAAFYRAHDADRGTQHG